MLLTHTPPVCRRRVFHNATRLEVSWRVHNTTVFDVPLLASESCRGICVTLRAAELGVSELEVGSQLIASLGSLWSRV